MRPPGCGRIHQTIAGDGELGYDGDGQSALTAAMAFPRGIAVWNGDVVFSDIDNQRVRRIRCGDGTIDRRGVGLPGPAVLGLSRLTSRRPPGGR